MWNAAVGTRVGNRNVVKKLGVERKEDDCPPVCLRNNGPIRR